MNRGLLAALLLAVASMALAGDVQNIRLKPEGDALKVARLEKPEALETVYPFASTERRSFTASVKIEVGNWSHYGGIRMGFRSSKFDDRFEVWMSKGDDGMRSVAMDLEVAGGAGFRSTLCHLPPDLRSFVVTFKYNAHLSRFKMIVSNDNRVLGESDWKKIRGYFVQDEFFIRALRGKDGLQPGTSIAWDGKDVGLRVVSHTGNEGGMKYLLELLIKETRVEVE